MRILPPRSNRRLIILFLAAVLLPSAVLILLTGRSIRQERELAAKRTADERARMVVQVRQSIGLQLEDIKSKVLSLRGAGQHEARYADSAVLVVADIVGGRVVLPWESLASLAPRDRAFATKVRAAEYQEFVRKDAAAALASFRTIIESATDPAQAASARLAVARVLTKLGRTREAAHEYRMLLSLGLDAADEHGVPFAVYAATALRRSNPSAALRVASAAQRECCLSPEALYMLRHLVDSIGTGASALETNEATGVKQLLDERIRRAQQALALQTEFPNLGLSAGPRGGAPAPSSRWILYGANPWFVTAAPLPGETSSIILGIDASQVMAALNRRLPSELGVDARIRTAEPDDAAGLSLSPDYPGLSVAFAPPGVSAPVGGLARSFYVGTLIVVLSVTSFGAYLLWRDVRRELRVAEMRSQFVSSVSHELKTPLTAIRMFAETLALPGMTNSDRRREYLDTIVNETERLSRLLNNVLDFSRIERGQKAYRLEPTVLASVVQRSARTLEYPLAQQGFQLSVDVAAEIPPVAADEDALQQAVLNLLTNAMKYAGANRDISLRLHRVNGEAVIAVQDHGIGIPAAYQSRVTEKFYRVPSPENAGIPGTGLGLTLVDHIAKGHGGRLEIESAVGLGSTFAIHLPLDRAT